MNLHESFIKYMEGKIDLADLYSIVMWETNCHKDCLYQKELANIRTNIK